MFVRRTAVPLAAAILSLCLVVGPSGAQIPTRNVTVMAHFDEYAHTGLGDQNYSACWAYIHSDGREYAMLGVAGAEPYGTPGGTAIYNVTDPAATYPVAFIPGPASFWREMKQYRDWVYIVTEAEGPGFGLQIVRMSDPEHPVLVGVYTTNFTHSHTVSVDTTRAPPHLQRHARRERRADRHARAVAREPRGAGRDRDVAAARSAGSDGPVRPRLRRRR
jgi:hypothetical protein